MPDPPKKKKNVFQKIAAVAKDFQEWVEETFGDPELAAEIKDDLGLDADQPGDADADRSGAPRPASRRSPPSRTSTRWPWLEVIADIKATVDTVMTFVDAVKADGVDASNVVLDDVQGVVARRAARPQPGRLRPRADRSTWLTEDDETLPASSTQRRAAPSSSAARRRGRRRSSGCSGCSMLGGVTVVLIVTFWDALGGVIDVDLRLGPRSRGRRRGGGHRQPGAHGRARRRRARRRPSGARRSSVCPAAHGGPGLFVSTTVGFQFADGRRRHDVHDRSSPAPASSACSSPATARSSSPSFAPAIRISAEPQRGDDHAGRRARPDRRHRRRVAAADRRPGLRRRGRRRSGRRSASACARASSSSPSARPTASCASSPAATSRSRSRSP